MDTAVLEIIEAGLQFEEIDQEACYVRIPRQLERDLYEKVNKVFKAYGGQWISGKIKAHRFDYPLESIREFFQAVIDTKVMPKINPLSFFWTASDVAGHMLSCMPCLGGSGLRILEPSAGTGHLIDVILAEFDRPFITAVELDPFRAKILRRKYAHLPNVGVIEADFTVWAASAFGRREFDACIMNPPFATEGDSLAYVNHIALAWSLLGADGQLASVVPQGIDYRDDDATKRLRQKMKEKGAVEKLPELSFKEAGTGTKTAFVYADKSVGPYTYRIDPKPTIPTGSLQIALF